MINAVCFPRRNIRINKPFFFEEQQTINQDENFTWDKAEPMDIDTTS